MKDDGVDTAYHLVAWVSPVPTNPIVEFEIQQGNILTSLGAATRVAGTNTWELKWSNPPADGAYTLNAILYDGQTVKGRDEIAITVNNEGGARDLPTQGEPQGETVELIYPSNGGQLGFYTSGSGTAATTNAVIRVTVSQGTESVSLYYTTSPSGTEPEWLTCGSNVTPPAGSDPARPKEFTARCRLAADVPATAVTGIAAVANENDLGDPTGEVDDGIDAGDAHTVTAYVQKPTSVLVTPSTQRQEVNASGGYPCSQVITAQVLDQNAQPVYGVNVDVHGQGPTDNLRFDDSDSSGDNTSRTQPPDGNAHRLEAGSNCEADPPVPTSTNQQGSHDLPPGTADIKHTESIPSTAAAPAGTNQNGEFTFQLHSLDAGVTQFTVWADTQDDDRFCSSEANGSGSIGWGADPGIPTGVAADTSDCPEPSPTPTPTQSASPDPSPSDPSPTPTDEPGEECPDYEGDSRNQVVGTPDDDQLEGTEGDDIICGLGGNDTISGLGGNDVIIGGDGNDLMRGDEGNDELDGGNGKDDARGNAGNDTVKGGDQNDVLLGNSGDDTLVGNGGFDILRGGDGDDFAAGGGGRDTLQGGRGEDELRGGAGKDTIKGGAENDEIRGGKGDDFLKGGGGADLIIGGGGTDTCSGGRGKDRVRGCEK